MPQELGTLTFIIRADHGGLDADLRAARAKMEDFRRSVEGTMGGGARSAPAGASGAGAASYSSTAGAAASFNITPMMNLAPLRQQVAELDRIVSPAIRRLAEMTKATVPNSLAGWSSPYNPYGKMLPPGLVTPYQLFAGSQGLLSGFSPAGLLTGAMAGVHLGGSPMSGGKPTIARRMLPGPGMSVFDEPSARSRTGPMAAIREMIEGGGDELLGDDSDFAPPSTSRKPSRLRGLLQRAGSFLTKRIGGLPNRAAYGAIYGATEVAGALGAYHHAGIGISQTNDAGEQFKAAQAGVSGIMSSMFGSLAGIPILAADELTQGGSGGGLSPELSALGGLWRKKFSPDEANAVARRGQLQDAATDTRKQNALTLTHYQNAAAIAVAESPYEQKRLQAQAAYTTGILDVGAREAAMSAANHLMGVHNTEAMDFRKRATSALTAVRDSDLAAAGREEKADAASSAYRVSRFSLTEAGRDQEASRREIEDSYNEKIIGAKFGSRRYGQLVSEGSAALASFDARMGRRNSALRLSLEGDDLGAALAELPIDDVWGRRKAENDIVTRQRSEYIGIAGSNESMRRALQDRPGIDGVSRTQMGAAESIALRSSIMAGLQGLQGGDLSLAKEHGILQLELLQKRLVEDPIRNGSGSSVNPFATDLSGTNSRQEDLAETAKQIADDVAAIKDALGGSLNAVTTP